MPPKVNAPEVFRAYCHRCGEDELLFLATYYARAVTNNMREEADHQLVGNDIELARTRMRHRENMWRGVTVTQVLKERRSR